MKKLFLFAFAAIVMLMSSCSRGDKELLRAVPEEADALMRVDLKAVAKSLGASWTDILKMTATKVNLQDDNCGIDLSGMIYAFVTEDSQMKGVVLPVSDVDDLKALFERENLALEENDGIYGYGGSVAFDDTRLVIAIGPEATAFNLHSLLKRNEVDDDVMKLDKRLDDIGKPISAVYDGEIFKQAVAHDFTVNMMLASLPFDLDDVFVNIGVDGTENTMVVDASLVGEDSEAQDQVDKFKKILTPIKDAKIPFVADKFLALVATNLHGESLKDMAGMFREFGTDPLFEALDGLATFTLTGLDLQQEKPAFVFTAQANDIACLDQLMGNIGKIGISVKDEGHHSWTIDDGKGDKLLVGAQGGFVFANYGNGMQRPKGDNTVALEKGTVFYVKAFPASIPSANKVDVGFSLQNMQELELYATDELEAKLTLKSDVAWSELINNE